MEYRYNRKAYNNKIEALAKLNLKIFKTISEVYHGYVNKDTVYQNLINLKSYVALNLSSYKITLRNKYHLITKGPKGTKVLEWLARYKRVYADIKKLNMPEIQGDSPVWDFINAAKSINEKWATGIRLQLTISADQNKDFNINLPALIQNLQTFQRSLQVAHGQSTMTSAFHATHSPSLTIPTCICGEKHWFNQCNYLNIASKPPNWTPNPNTFQAIQNALSTNPALQDKIDKALAKERDFQKKKLGYQKPTQTHAF